MEDFTKSWRDGLAFNAIIHRNRPDLVEWKKLDRRAVRERIDLAFHVMEREYGVTRLLDPEGKLAEKQIRFLRVSDFRFFIKWHRKVKDIYDPEGYEETNSETESFDDAFIKDGALRCILGMRIYSRLLTTMQHF